MVGSLQLTRCAACIVLVCMATRSPCEDQALPLSRAPPSSTEGGKSPQGQPCCRLQWLRLSIFSAAGRLTEFFREPGHPQMPGRSWRAGQAPRRIAQHPEQGGPLPLPALSHQSPEIGKEKNKFSFSLGFHYISRLWRLI